MKLNYKKTLIACYFGFITQAISANFAPLLFLMFHKIYSISLGKIALISTIFFFTQLLVDVFCAKFVDRIGYRKSIVMSEVFSSAGLLCMAFMPGICTDPFVGIMIGVFMYAVGSGLIEVLCSPIVEACPFDNKDSVMSLLHSFYCWGSVGVIVLSTMFFAVFGMEHWKWLACIWALVPLYNVYNFMTCPIEKLVEDGNTMGVKGLLKVPMFWISIILMVCAGASELSMSQWASAYVEAAIGLPKTIGDLAGPCMFAIMMGISRVIYGKYGEKRNLMKFMLSSGILCLVCYLMASLSQNPLIGLIGCIVCGFSVGIMWPGTISISSKQLPAGGTAMFALLAMAGDLGGAVGPSLVGNITQHANNNLQAGMLAGCVFPLILIISLIALILITRRKYMKNKHFSKSYVYLVLLSFKNLCRWILLHCEKEADKRVTVMYNMSYDSDKRKRGNRMVKIKAIPAPFTKGVNVTNWLEFRTADQINKDEITKQDFCNIKKLGCDVVRLPIHFEKICEGIKDMIIPKKIFDILDEVVSYAEELKLYIIFDFHNATHAESVTSNDVESVLSPIWRQVAEHYKNASKYIIYELMNEPHGIEIPVWNEIVERVFHLVRRIDQQHYIVVGGADWNSFNAMKTLPDFRDDKVIFTFHYYDPHTFTHQGASWCHMNRIVGIPFPYDKERMPQLPENATEEERERFENYPEQGTIERMKPFFDQYAEFSQQRKVPIFCGEFGSFALAAPKEDRVRWYQTVTSLLEERGISRTSWDYFGGFGLFDWSSMEKRFKKPAFPEDLNMDIVKALGLSIN